MIKKFGHISLIVLLAGCALTPDYHRPPVETPESWRGGATAGEPTPLAADWWKSFGSAELDALMEQALAQNNDLRASLHRIEQARANVKIAGAALLPAAAASAGTGWTQSRPSSGGNDEDTSWRGGAGISYELDLFGANRAVKDATRADYDATRYDGEALALVVMGDVAETYFTLVNLRERLAIARDNLKNNADILRIVEARVDAGSSSALDIAQQKSILAGNEASVATLEQQQANAENALSVLLGHAPRDMGVKTQTLKDITLPVIAAGQPSALLERRPDIRGAEAGLRAANADIGAARAAFFPSVTLGLDWGVAASPVGGATGTALSLASALATPIFQGGRLSGTLERTKARQAELAENYHKTVLTSFRETEDALAAVKAAAARQTALTAARDEARKAYDLSRRLYEAGAIDFQTLLDSQRSLFSAEDSYAQTRLATLTAAVDLFKALGGGWADKGV